MIEKDKVVLKASGLEKSFKLPHEKQNSIKSKFVGFFNNPKSYENQHVLNGLSFEVKKGEFFGIVGRNGSGKSTLLKVLSGIYEPDKGHVAVQGKLTPFIELGVGFSPELTGRENVFLNGALLGFNREEISAMYDEIVEFAELTKFMDQKLKNYSSGMQVRLAFSIAIRANTDILVLDEVLAVGDADFQRKCFNYFKQLKRANKTIILVTHDMGAVKEYCDRAILIQDGKITSEGHPSEVANQYLKLFNSVEDEITAPGRKSNNRWGNKSVRLLKHNIEISEKILINFEIKSDRDIKDVVVGFRFYDSSDNLLAGGSTVNAKSGAVRSIEFQKNQKRKITFEFPNILGTGDYRMGYTIRLADMVTICDENDDLLRLSYNSPESYQPIICPTKLTID